MSNKKRQQQGFTLLEVMIALTIFAVISSLAWQILDGAMRTTAATDKHAGELNQLQRAYNLLERDLFQLQARAPRNNGEVFVQDKTSLTLSTLNSMSGQAQLQRVAWEVHDGWLWRDVWPAIDSPADVTAEEIPIVNGVKEVSWRFYQQSWLDKWTDSAQVPKGVEVLITMENGQNWRWMFTTPGDNAAIAEPEPEAKTAEQTATDAQAAAAQTATAETAPAATATAGTSQ